MRALRGRLGLPALVVALVVVAVAGAAVGAVLVNHDRRGSAPAVAPGTSGLPGPEAIRGALRQLAERLHRVPDLALIRLERGVITFQYYAPGRADLGAFVDWKQGRLGPREVFRFPNNVTAPQLRFDPAELRLDGVVRVDRWRAGAGLGNWSIVRAEGFRRGAVISDGSGIVWRVTVARGTEQRWVFTNQAGLPLRIADIPAPPA